MKKTLLKLTQKAGILVIALTLTLFGTSFIGKQSDPSFSLSKAAGEVAGVFTDKFLTVAPTAIGPGNASAQALSAYQNVGGTVGISGNVGIGITNPQAPLEINNGSGVTMRFFPGTKSQFRMDSWGSALEIYTTQTSGTNNSNQLYLASPGSVGIGIIPTTNLKLQVAGKVVAAEGAPNTDTTNGAGFSFNESGGDTGMFSQANNQVELWTANTERLRINSTGNIGIGTANPGAKLSIVQGGIGLGMIGLYNGVSNDPTNYMQLGEDSGWTQYIANNAYYTGTQYYYVNPGGYGGTASRIAQSSGTISLDTANGGTNPITWNNRVYIANNGNVGIGTASPGQKLEVSGAIRMAPGGQGWTWTNVLPASNYIEAYADGESSSVGINYFISRRDSKKNFEALDNVVDSSKIYDLPLQAYNMKSDFEGAAKTVGIVAEDAAAILPVIASYDDNGEPHHVNYELMSVLMLDQMQKQKVEKDKENALIQYPALIKINEIGYNSYQVNGSDGDLATKISALAQLIVAKIQAGIIETQKLIVNGVDILEKLNILTQKVETQQKEIDALRAEIEALKNH